MSLPAGWALVALGELLTGIDSGKSFKCEERPPAAHEVGVVKVSAVSWGEYDERESKTCVDAARVQPAYFVQRGDFLLSRANTVELVGACVIARQVTQRVMLSDKILRLRFVDDDMKPWVLHFLRSAAGRQQIEALASGNQESMRNIGQERLRQIIVPFAPAAERARLVDAMEDALLGLDTAAGDLHAAKRKLTLYRQSLLKSAVDGSLMAGWRGGNQRAEPRTDADLPTLPKGWHWSNLGAEARIQGGIQKQPSRAPAVNRFPFLRVANVLRGKLRLDDVHEIELFGDEIERFRLLPDDLLIVEGNGSLTEIGRCARWDGSIPDTVHQNHLIRARPLSMSSAFVEAWLNSPWGIALLTRLAATTSGLYTLSVSKLSRLPVPVPSRGEQDAIVGLLVQQAVGIGVHEAAIDHALAMLAAQRQNILRAAFSGRLVPQDPNDEPASVLLERIRAGREQAPKQSARPARKRTTPA